MTNCNFPSFAFSRFQVTLKSFFQRRKYGEDLYNITVGKKSTTYVKILHYAKHTSGLILEVHCHGAVFNGINLKPHLMTSFVRSMRFLEEREYENVGKTLVPKVELLED